jgi:hypothetical protein
MMVVTPSNEERMKDTIVLTIPTGSAYRGVASLVLGGVGSRLELPYERVDDLQLAVLSMLDASGEDTATVEITAEDERVAVSVGPLRPGAESDDGLALVLRRLSDGVEAHPRDGKTWLTVVLARAGAAAPGSIPSSS